MHRSSPSPSSRSRLACVALALLLPACAAHDDATTTGAQNPVETEPPKPEPASVAPDVDVTVASVQLNENCPDPKPSHANAARQAPEAESAKREAKGAELAGDVADDDIGVGKHYAPECVQSTLQLAIVSRAEAPVSVEIAAIRLYQNGKETVLSEIEARGPTRWSEGTYTPWDEMLPAKSELNVGYKLADPNWAAVTKAIGQPAWGPTYVVEVDVLLDKGTKQTVRSTPVPREMPDQVET